MSLPAPLPLNSNFRLIRNTKISASLNMMSSLKKQCPIICTSRNHNEVQTQICTALLFSHPYQITFYFSFMLWCRCGFKWRSNAIKAIAFTAHWLRDIQIIGFLLCTILQVCHVIYRRCTGAVVQSLNEMNVSIAHALIIGLNQQKDGNRLQFFHPLI